MSQLLLRGEPEVLRRSLVELLTQFAGELQKEDLRAKVVALIPAFHTLRDLGSSLIQVGEEEGGRARILAYLKRYAGQPIDGDELMVVSGDGLWARRVNELRVKFGWRIYGGATFADLADIARALGDQEEVKSLEALGIRPSHYVLMSTEEDRDAAHRWNILRDVRSRRKWRTLKEKMLAYFRRNLGRAITAEELKALANGSKKWVGAIGSLMAEDGGATVTRGSHGDKTVWVMEKDGLAEEYYRRIRSDLRVVLEEESSPAHGAVGRVRCGRVGDGQRKKGTAGTR